MTKFQDTRPIYLQIVDSLSDSILGGQYPENERIPSVRELGEQLGVNPNTCVRSYEILTRDGIIEARRGMGYWVSEGAKERIQQHMQQEFFEQTVPEFKKRILTLGVELDKVLNLLK